MTAYHMESFLSGLRAATRIAQNVEDKIAISLLMLLAKNLGEVNVVLNQSWERETFAVLIMLPANFNLPEIIFWIIMDHFIYYISYWYEYQCSISVRKYHLIWHSCFLIHDICCILQNLIQTLQQELITINWW